MIEAIVLAGGSSTRMGSPKALLPAPDGRPFVVRIIETLQAAWLTQITVVTGVHHRATVEACESLMQINSVRWVVNPEPSRGQLSSLQTAMSVVPVERAAGLLMTLVDVPMVTVETVRTLLGRFAETGAPIVRPVVAGRHGHPVIFGRAVFSALQTAPLDVGARAVLRTFSDAIEDVEVSDPGCLMDIDTPDDYQRLSELTRP